MCTDLRASYRFCFHYNGHESDVVYLFAHAFLSAGQLEQHRRQELGDNILQLLVCLGVTQTQEHTLQLICIHTHILMLVLNNFPIHQLCQF